MEKSIRLIKYGIWGYFFLLLFEGALRKWFLPGLATPLLLARDPLVLWIIYLSWKQGLFPSNIYLNSMLILGVIAVLTAMFLGHGNLTVAIYGARALMIHFPMVFIIGKIFDSSDVIKLGKMLLLIAVPMTILIALQFYSPQSAWVNRGLGDDAEGAGFSGALGYMRPPGTFSFTTGVSMFYGLASSFVFYFWLNVKYINKWILIMATIALLIAIPLSISRSLLFQVILTALFLVLAVVRNPAYTGKILMTIGIGIIGIIILSTIPMVQTATEVFTSRIDNAGESEGGLKGTFIDRFLGEQTGAFRNATEAPYFGYGIGMGTNAGSQLLTGERGFLISEGEWGRVIGEMGLVLGLFVIIIRIALTAKLVVSSVKELGQGKLLPWMLTSYGFVLLLSGGWAQPMALGFYTLTAGLMLASLKEEFNHAPIYTLNQELS
jgi:hypothetical protein